MVSHGMIVHDAVLVNDVRDGVQNERAPMNAKNTTSFEWSFNGNMIRYEEKGKNEERKG